MALGQWQRVIASTPVSDLPQRLGIVQVAYKHLMVYSCPKVAWLEEVYAVQVGNVDSPVSENTRVRQHTCCCHYTNWACRWPTVTIFV